MTIEQQIRFMQKQRKLYADLILPEAVQMANAILASLTKAAKFTRGRG